MLKNIKQYLTKAKEEKFALGQFNFCTLEQFQGIVQAAKKTSSPIICGVSGGEAEFLGIEEAAALVRIARERDGVAIFLNLDHGKDVDIIKRAVDIGYDAVHFDGSDLSFEENVKFTKEVVSYARKREVIVEGEIGKIEGSSVPSDQETEELILTSMEKVVRFTKHTGIDSIALDVGTLHGTYANAPKVHFDRIKQAGKETGSFIVLHGGSGVNDDDIRKAVETGVVKININTELRVVWKNALYGIMKENLEEVVPYNILPAVREAVVSKVEEKIKLFNSVGKL